MKKTIKYLQDGEYHYATVKDVGDLEQLKTQHKEDLVTALNELFTTGGSATPTGYDDLVKKVNDTQTTVDGINSTITDVNGKVVAHDEAIAQAKKDLQDALAQFQEFNDEIEQAKKDAETELANAKQALKDEFTDNLADAQKANQKQLEDKVSAIQGNLDTTSNTLNDVKTQLTNAKLDYGNVNTSIQKLNDMLATKLSSTDLDPLKTSIQNQETEIQQTKDSIATKAGKAEFDVLSGRVSTAESKIKQQADEISLGVKKSELNGAIDNYQVEGTNRLRDTIDFDIDNGYWKLDQYSINSNTDVHPYDQAHDVSALVLQKTGSAKQDVDFTNEDLGNSFVISVWNKKDAQPQVWYGNTQLTNRQVADIKGDYERSFFTFIPTDVNVKTIMFKYDAGTVDQLVIGEPKLELGTKPKAYAPNPNDEHKQIVNTKAELKIASDKIESTVEKQTKTDNNINQLSSRVTQTEQGITATNDLITKTKDGLIKDYTGKIDANAKSLSSEFEEKTNEKIGQITDSGENLILNSAFTNETDRKDKWQNISDKVNIVDDGNGLMWAKMSQSGLTADNPISLTSNYFPIKQGKITVGVDIKSDNTDGLSGAKILVLQTYNANKQRVDFTELTLENMGLTVQQLADGQSHRGVYRLGNDRSDAVYMTVKAVLPRNGSIYFTNFSAKLSSIDNGGYTPNAEDLKRQILNQKTKIEQNSQQITLKASSTELRDVRTIANGAVSSATNANNNASSAMNTANTANSNANQANSKIIDIQANGGGRNLLVGTGTATGDVANGNGTFVKGAFNGYDAVKTNTKFSERYINMKSALGRTNAKAGDWFTLSVYVKADKQINTGAISDYRITGTSATSNDGTFRSILMADKPITTQWQQYSFIFQINDTSLQRQNTRIEYSLSTGDNWIYWAGWMLEKGTVAHEWQPAPEDIQSQIDQARTDIQSTLTVANNGITAATNLKTTYDNYVQKNDANIKLLGDRITNEVSKITSNGGGRNLWINSKKFANTAINTQTVNWNADNDGITTAHITGTGGFYGKWAQIYTNSTDPFAIGDSETFSVEMKGTGTITIGRENDFVKAVTLTNTWARYSVSGVVNHMNAAHIMYNNSGKDCDAYVRLPMVEKGVIAHEWQPAPEDTNSQIEAVSSKIDQTATSITSTVNSTKQDLQGQINNTNTKITQTANSITEQLKSYSKTGDMQNYVNTTIQKTADGINTKVSGVESKVNGITSNGGGRNLLRYSTNDNGKFQPNMSRIDNYIIYAASTAYMTQGQQYTVHANASSGLVWSNTHNPNVESNNVVLWLVDNKSVNQIISDANTKTGTTFTWNHPSGIYYLRVNTYKTDNSGYAEKVMLEKGVVAHDWQPAPEDTDNAIQTAKADLVQQITDAKNAAIKVSKDSINSEVSDVRTTITQVNNKASSAVNTANSANTNANSALTKANNATTVANSANTTANTANNNATSAVSVANGAKSTADNVNNRLWSIQANGGGRNLLKGTRDFSGVSIQGSKVAVTNGQEKFQAAYGTQNSSQTYFDLLTFSAIPLEKDADYTASFWVKTSENTEIWSYLYDSGSNGTYSDGATISQSTTDYTRIVVHFHNGNNNATPNFIPVRINKKSTITVWLYGCMLEEGTVAHDWSPAPEDVATDISNVNTKVEQYKTGIDQTATGMNLFAQVITGNNSIDVTKSNIGIDPNQIKIASNKIVIDGNTSINGDVISANNIKSGGTIEGVGLTIKNGDHVTTVDDRGFIDYKNNNKTVISDGTFMSNRVSLSGELQTSEKTTVNGATQYQTVSVGNGRLTFALYPFDPTPDIQINTSSSSTSTNSTDNSTSTSTDNTDHPDLTFTTAPGVATAGKELDGVGGKISASYGLPNLQTGTNDMTGLEILGQNISLTARKVADTIDVSSIDKSIIDINNNAIKIGVLQNGGRGNASNIFIDNSGINLDTQWLTFDVTNMKVNGNAEFNNTYYTMFKPTGNQDALYVVSQKNGNSTQNDYAQTTLRAGSKYGTYGDSGLTFYWNSVKAFGTFDLRDTHVLGNRNTHFSVETTFDTDGEANMCFTWTSRSDLWNNIKLPMLARADWWTSQWGSCGLGFANGRLFYFTNDGHTYKQLN